MSNDRQDRELANDADNLGYKETNGESERIARHEQPAGIKDTSGEKQDGGGNDRRRRAADICRICHMGGFPGHGGNPATWGSGNEASVPRTDSDASTLSSYADLGPLISACKCRGTVGLVHADCLERWLTESGHTRCELCGYKYATKRVPRHNIFRSLVIWFNTVIVTRQMILDILYLVVTTPLAFFSCYICALAITMLANNGFRQVPWMLLAMLPTCFLTLVAYSGWVLTLGRLHGRRWRRYWRNNFVIRLLPDNGSDINELITAGSMNRVRPEAGEEEEEEDDEEEEEGDEGWRGNEIEELIEIL